MDGAASRVTETTTAALTRDQVLDELSEVERKAWDGLAREQYWIFGVYAGRYRAMAALWRRSTGESLPNPFAHLGVIGRSKTGPPRG